jgi:hypothetical protein
MVLMLARNVSMSSERISRSVSGMWPLSCAVAISMTACSSGGRSFDRDGRSLSDWSRISVEMRFVRASVRLWGRS